MNVAVLAKKAPNRKNLYQKIQRVYDLPAYSPVVNTDYLKEILKENSNFLKVRREKTQHVPLEEVKRFKTKELFELLEKTLQEKKLPPTGFSEFGGLPNIAWMLRMLIWADKSKKKLIIKRHEMNNKDRKERLLAEKTMEIDKDIAQVMMECEDIHSRNQFRLYSDQIEDSDQLRINSLKIHIQNQEKNIWKLKIQIEKKLLTIEESKEKINLVKKEREIKQRRKSMKIKKKQMQQQSLEKYSLILKKQIFSLRQGNFVQLTPLTDKFFKLRMDSGQSNINRQDFQLNQQGISMMQQQFSQRLSDVQEVQDDQNLMQNKKFELEMDINKLTQNQFTLLSINCKFIQIKNSSSQSNETSKTQNKKNIERYFTPEQQQYQIYCYDKEAKKEADQNG